VLAAGAFYCATAQRTISWQDSGMFQWRVLEGDYCGHLGLALAHPLYIAGGRTLALLSQDRLPLLLNCFSGLGAAVALANLAAVAALLTGKRWAGLLTAAMLATAHTVWWLSTAAEVYTWSLAGFTLEVWLLVKLLRQPGWGLLVWLGLVNGLGLCVHNFALLPLPVYVATAIVLIARRRLPAWSLAAAGGAWLAGAGLYIGMVVDLAASTGDWLGAVRSALTAGYGSKMLSVAASTAGLKENLVLSGANFAGLLLPLAVVGWCRLAARLGRGQAVALGAVTAVHVLFFATYRVPDQFTFILPSLAMIALATTVGLSVLTDVSRGWRGGVVAACLASLLWQPGAYWAGPHLAASLGVKVIRQRQLPFRDEVRYWLTPWKHNERSAEQFCRAAFSQAGPNGVILPDSTSRYPLLLYKRLVVPKTGVTVQTPAGPLPDWRTDPAGFREAVDGRPLYLVSRLPGYTPAELLANLEEPFKTSDQDALYSARWKNP